MTLPDFTSMTSYNCTPTVGKDVDVFCIVNMERTDAVKHGDGEDLKQFFRLMNKLRSNQTECSDYFARESSSFEELRQRVLKLIEESRELQTRTENLRCGFREIDEKFKSIKKMLYKEFGLQAEKRLQNLEEVAYMNGLITHLQEVDKGLTYRPVYVSDPAEYDDECQRTPDH